MTIANVSLISNKKTLDVGISSVSKEILILILLVEKLLET